ncbi:DUF6894 family protein [Methylobacterium brachythecii]|uniref:DUF6894 domain-containing protein n=1 Tax=Methylobacterium brachythecii TaxID=1176177 RepID=A0A7W6AM53_9HYPH|nr:hypothetical protein [Methylobacterium brachythecii]MBB3903660.1 hypothetical protein [Methylobacterium brachythecii]GLS44231.1 hypothetical protein GCM10007884_22190 [Methylobacterium brachythecii]
MPRYFFHVRDGKGREDVDGTVKADLDAAKREAVLLAANLMGDYAGDLIKAYDWRIDVTDERGQVLFQIDMQITNSPVSRGDPLTMRSPARPSA